MITVTDNQRIYVTHILDEKRRYITEHDSDDNRIALKILTAARRDYMDTIENHGEKMTALQRSTIENTIALIHRPTISALEEKVYDLLGFDHPAAFWYLKRMNMLMRDHPEWFNNRTEPLYSMM